MNKTSGWVEEVLAEVAERNPGEHAFHQAVGEVVP